MGSATRETTEAMRMQDSCCKEARRQAGKQMTVSEIVYVELIATIVQKMRGIIGSVAVVQANKVSGLKIDGGITLEGDPVRILDALLSSYKGIIGPVAIALAKQAVKSVLEKNPKLKVPKALKNETQKQK